MRLGAIFVIVCMVIIAGSAGAIAYLYFGLGGSEAAVVALVVLIALGLYNMFSGSVGIRSTVGRQLTDLSRGSADVARQVAEMGRRLAAVESKVETSLDRARAVTDPLSVEIGDLGTLVKQLAENVAAQQTILAELAQRPAMPASNPVDIAESPPAAPATPVEPAAPPQVPAAADATSLQDAARAAALATIRDAIESNRIDLYLQPIVTLPQRKVRYYEAMSRLRTEGGELMHAADFIAQAESAGLFCNLSSSTLTDSVFPQILEFLDANRAIAPSLVLEFTQSAVRAMGPIEHESLAALAERGFRFSLDNVVDLRIEPRELASRSFRFIKIPARFLLTRDAATADIHPADLSDLVGRFGIDLIADKIESEGSVVDLLDCDVRFGQGFLFSPPRPVRAEALQGVSERNDLVTRENPGDQAAPSNVAGRGLEAAAPDAGKGDRTTGLAQIARGVVSRG